jgi:sulfur-carrier protein
MSIKVLIPTPLQKFVGDQSALECEAGSISQLVEALETQHPGIKARLCDDSGKLRRFVNFYLNSEDIRFMENEETVLSDGDEVSIVPAIAGG